MTHEKIEDKQVVHEKIVSKQVNFLEKKTEGEWRDTLDDFFIEATPKIFEWMRWVIVLAIVDYIDRISDSTIINIVHVILYVFTFGYFMSYFYQIKFIIFREQKSVKVEYRSSVLVSGIFTLGVWFLVSQSVDIISESYPFNKTEQNNQEIGQQDKKHPINIEKKAKTNSSIQTTKTLVETNHEPNTSEIKEDKEEIKQDTKSTANTEDKRTINSYTQPTKILTDPKIEKNLLKEKRP